MLIYRYEFGGFYVLDVIGCGVGWCGGGLVLERGRWSGGVDWMGLKWIFIKLLVCVKE